MSPASAGNLEVERYIGACLISQNRVKNKPPPPQRQEQYNNNNNNNNRDVTQDIYRKHHVNYRLQRCHSVETWNGGGMPFITFPHHHHHHQRKEDQNSLAKLAVHTQGAPLILTKTFHHRKNRLDRNNNGKVYENSINKKNVKCQNSADAASVASDESSGSNNSETCLPRIIKPRKRRKKERKPPTLSRPLSQDSSSTDSASPDVENNRIDYLSLSPFNLFNFSPYGALMFPESSKIVDRLNDINETPKLHHSFEDIEEPDEGKDINGNQSTSNCQCRYCDPSGQIWDVDRECYSPFLTPPLKSFKYPNPEEVSYYSSPISTDCLEHTLSSITLESDGVKKIPVTSSSRDLEVSTEIVTSLNGHRDLEIKFFSTPCHVDNDAKNDNGTKKCNFENDLGLNLEE
ncbi:uncharacterized protein LOC130899562 [Diorhabda carinulata]|uniref:uncharacterized protein LOC130899562 n=1 Tax=Diorhabda carinulata TaxID=1163345 RepID=UPI0025A246B9|nr:uncharacterized protein LOC130899562 [Diorhabda carinulata]XP_057665572.1 uncharacterized protein LOC130899562 [Diorhabda carinulata]